MYLLFHVYYIWIEILQCASKPKSLLPILYKAHPLFLRTFLYGKVGGMITKHRNWNLKTLQSISFYNECSRETSFFYNGKIG
jgi:hypothetical protein